MASGMDWFRWHHGSVNDPKFGLVAKRSGAGVAEVIAVWVFLLEAASQAEQRGFAGKLDFEAMEYALDLADGLVAKIIAAMEARGLVDGPLAQIVSWEKRQPKRERVDDDAASRKRKQRETEAVSAVALEAVAESGQGGVTAGVTPCHAMSRQKQPRGEESREEEKREDKPPTHPAPSIAAEPARDSTAAPTMAGTVCKAIKAKGVPDVNPSHPALRAFIERGVPVATFEAAAEVCARASPPKGMQYLLGIVKRQFDEAADIAKRPRLQAGPWDATRSSILAKAAELGIEPWNENDLSVDRETFAAYEARVRRLVEVEVPA